MTTLTATLALSMLPKIGPIRVKRLVERFGSPEEVLSAPVDRLSLVEGIGPGTAKIIATWKDLVDPEAELEKIHSGGMSLLLPSDPAFPAALRELYDCPLFLYVWGEVLECDKHAIAIVGSRNATIYGLQSAKKISSQLASSGITVISGLARGIDTAAHEGALDAGGRTIAVIGSGLTKLYPPENFSLAQKIADGHGAVVSEFPLQKAPDKQTFPQRNRIVAGWSKGLVVVECPQRSGSLITANLATDAGKTVYAVPGQIDRPTSDGCNQLIRDGATLITSAADVLEDLHSFDFHSRPTEVPGDPEERPTPVLSERETLIYKELNSTEASIDSLVDRLQLPSSIVSMTLLALEIKGLAQALPGQLYVKI